MTAPFPYDGIAGATLNPAEREAIDLYIAHTWVARLVNEMDQDADLNLKKIFQFVHHSQMFVASFDALAARGPSSAPVVSGFMQFKGSTWASNAAMNADLQAIRDKAEAGVNWIEANATEYKSGFATRMVNANGDESDVAIVTTKPAFIATYLAQFRALFGPTPA